MKINKEFDSLNAVEAYFLYLEEEKFITALKGFRDNIGYSISEFVICAFASEYDSWEEGYFGEEGVKFEVEPPAVDDHKLDIITFNELYQYLDDMVNQYLVSNPDKRNEVTSLLNDIKSS